MHVEQEGDAVQPQTGRQERSRPVTPEPRLLGPEGRPCVRCGGLQHVIRQLEAELAELRGS